MSFLKKAFTPKDTEEIRPGLFVRKEKKGYKQIHPIVWNDEWRTKEQLKTILTLRTFFTIALIIFLAWAYVHDTGALQEFYEDVTDDPFAWCNDLKTKCSNYQGNNPMANLSGFITEDGDTKYTNPLSGCN